MKKEMITTALLCLAIELIAIGVHTSNLIIAAIGGAFCGIYNGILLKED